MTTRPDSTTRDVAQRSALWLTLGLWIGSWALFSAIVAPTAFRVLPSAEVAGTLIGPTLRALHLFGAGAGLVLAVLAGVLGRGPRLIAIPLIMSALCLYTHFGVSAEISELRLLAFDPEGNAGSAARFHQLHRVSVGIFTGLGAAAVLLLVLHARADRPSR